MIRDKEIERRRKISQTLKGRSPWNKGLKGWRILSDETRKKIGDAHRGKKVNVSEETRRKISQANKGKMPKNLAMLHALPRTEEWKRNISRANKGKKLTEETKRKISDTKRNLLSPLYKAIRRCFKSHNWRTQIFNRDNFICIFCKKRGGELNADHYPKRFVDVLRDNDITTMEQAFDCKELWDINNGRTLCLNCHSQTETWGNKYKNRS